ncbi:hypothetical protein AB0B94_30875 [Micromonospora sp. NPDC048986]|uniref:hypothetical protein n=1 Tax=Micromonospora sp. NPDC048986 TaxID=3155644 RepID=UPI003406ECB8
MPVGNQQPTTLLLDDAAWEREPVRLAEERGHTVIADGITQERYTCTRCDRAVLRVGCNIYGSAVETDCAPANQTT